MKKLNKWQNLVMQIGALVMLAGAVLPIFGRETEGAAALFMGSSMFGLMQIVAGYEGQDMRVRRLRRQQMLGALLLILSGILAIMHTQQIGHIGSGEWKLAFAVAAVFEGYTAFRLPTALRDAGEEC